MDVSTWLQGLGLDRYAQAFRDHDVDGDVLRDLTAGDLVDLGVRSVGHRRRLLAAIAAMREGRAVPPVQPAGVPERRQVTVLFCDLVDSTGLACRLDPEETREIIQAYQAAVLAEVDRFAGHLLKLLGDGVVACFGWPHAQEDAAERAVRAGLGAVGAVALVPAPGGGALAARVGIAAGLVVVGEGAAREEAIVGETPNLAARLQAVAEPGEVVIDAGARRLVGGLFDLRDLGARELKGFAAPVRAYGVRGDARGAESRFDAPKGGRLAALIGRERELDFLLDAWVAARAGAGRTVLVTGEGGIGKSRLARALLDRVAASGCTTLRCFCSPYHGATALFPVVEQLQRAAGFTSEDAPAIKLGKLETLLARGAAELDVPILAALLGVPAAGDHRLPELTPAALKARTLRALLARLTKLAREGPVLVLFEDLHWADPTTGELLTATAAAAKRLALLVLATARPEFRPPWPSDDAAVTTLPLGRLDRRQSVALLHR